MTIAFGLIPTVTMDVADRKVLVLGAGRSGVAAARFLAARGAVVALHDQKPFEKWTTDALDLKKSGIGCVPEEVPSWLLDQIELVIVSPGVPSTSIPIRYAERAGAEVIAEVELAFRYLKGRVIGITGTNGKTTTTTLIGRLLDDAALPVQVGGNIGRPLISLVEASREDGWTVVELSSFQLETIQRFRPTIAVVLNVTPNHMDRYESFKDYAVAKHRIFMNQTANDVAILNADDEVVSSWRQGLRARVVEFSTKRELADGLFLRDKDIVYRSGDIERVLLNRDEMKLLGVHNVQNALASLAAGLACGITPESMIDTLREFDPVEHRLEFVRDVRRVKFYNDSKATSVDATLKALEAFEDEPGKILLILGGRGKKAPYSPLSGLIKKKVRKLILIGEDAENIAQELGDLVPHRRVSDMSEAVSESFRAARTGDVVLLAPACASFDMFESFEHRGQEFKDAVRALQIDTEKAPLAKSKRSN